MRAKYLGDGERRQPEEISRVIGSIIEHSQVDVDIRQGDLVAEWGDIAPGDWARGTPIGVRDGTLLVTVRDGATASLLRYQHQALLDAIAASHGSDLVRGVRVRVERPQ
jgi:predicted nucleic acid-binding Zn ribbon protein